LYDFIIKQERPPEEGKEEVKTKREQLETL